MRKEQIFLNFSAICIVVFALEIPTCFAGAGDLPKFDCETSSRHTYTDPCPEDEFCAGVLHSTLKQGPSFSLKPGLGASLHGDVSFNGYRISIDGPLTGYEALNQNRVTIRIDPEGFNTHLPSMTTYFSYYGGDTFGTTMGDSDATNGDIGINCRLAK